MIDLFHSRAHCCL